MLKMIAKPLFLVMCAAMSFTAPMDICMAQDKQETLGRMTGDMKEVYNRFLKHRA